MPGLMDVLMQTVAGQTGDLSRSLNAPEGATSAAISAALPMLLASLTRNAASPEGASALGGALDRDHDGSVLDDLGALLGGPGGFQGDEILGHVLGSRRSAVETGVARSSGLDQAQTAQLMAMLAPVVMGALGKMKREQGLDAGGLAGALQTESQGSAAVGGLMEILDSDDDGQIMDDVASLGSSLLGSLFKGR